MRKLQTVVSRKAEDYISMMIEELSEYDNPVSSSQKYVIGRMIHLDSNAKVGTPFDNAKLMHLDLAYNLYKDNDADVRMRQRLSKGTKIQDATVRTHILRVEGIPFKAVLKFAQSFFQSQYLTDEWIKNEFGEMKY